MLEGCLYVVAPRDIYSLVYLETSTVTVQHPSTKPQISRTNYLATTEGQRRPTGPVCHSASDPRLVRSTRSLPPLPITAASRGQRQASERPVGGQCKGSINEVIMGWPLGAILPQSDRSVQGESRPCPLAALSAAMTKCAMSVCQWEASQTLPSFSLSCPPSSPAASPSFDFCLLLPTY